MNKTLGAGILMLLLLGASAWNILYLDDLTGRLESQIDTSRTYWLAGDTEGAMDALDDALSDWHGAEGYTHIFIRHAEVDAVTDAFYNVMSALSGDDMVSAGSEYDRLKAHLQSIDSMEHVTIKSVF